MVRALREPSVVIIRGSPTIFLKRPNGFFRINRLRIGFSIKRARGICMKPSIASISIAFAAGALGGLANAVTVWFLGAAGITALLGVSLAPVLAPSFLYQKIVWGGIWGFLFLTPVLSERPVLRGFAASLAPTLVQLLFVFPFVLGKGMLGLQLGYLTPLLVVLFNAVWGITAAFWSRSAATE